MTKAGFLETLEQQIKPVTVAAGLFTALSGVAAGWVADSAVIGASATLIVGFCALNVWLWRNSRPPNPFVPALAESKIHLISRWAFHILSAVAVVAAVGVIVILSREAWAVPAIQWAFGCEAAAPRAEHYVTGKGHTDVEARLALADCYEHRGRLAEAVAAMEALLNDQEALAGVKADERPNLLSFLHADIGLDLLMSYDSTLKTDAKQARQHLQEATLLRAGAWFARDLLAYATVVSSATKAEVREILDEAQREFQSMPQSSSDVRQHFHWQGRTLYQIGAYADAEKAFANELSLMSANEPDAAGPRGWLRTAEYGRTGDLPKLRQYLTDAATPAEREQIALALTDELILQADTADQQGNAKDAARIARDGEAFLATAVQFGAVEQDRVNRVKSALLTAYSGRYGEAVVMWRQIVKEEPSNRNYLRWYGRAARRASLFEEARDVLKTYVTMQPDDASGHSELGLAIDGLAEKAGTSQSIDLFRSAEQELNNAARLAPKDPVIAGLLRDSIEERAVLESGEAKIRSFEDALGWARRTRELVVDADSPAASEATRQLALLLNGLAYRYLMDNDDLPAARLYVDECLQFQPDLYSALDTKATILIRTAEKTQPASDRQPLLQEAEDLLGRAIKTFPVSDPKALSQYYEHKSHLAALQGNEAAALASARRALELDPSNVQARKQLR
jgi:hypothetical protein